MIRLTASILLFFNIAVLYSQLAVGTWRDHLPYHNVNYLAEAGNKIYCATDAGAVFYYNKEDYSLNKLSKVNGLSDVGVKTLAYSPELNVLIIGYNNSNIDLVTSSDIINFPDIRNKFSIVDKAINIIEFIGNYAYICCDFGIVLFDPVKKEFKEQYVIGHGGERVSVKDIAFDGTYIYAATEEGVYKADINNPNLVDYANWTKITNIPNSNGFFNAATYFNDKIFVNNANDTSEYDHIYYLENGVWEEFAEQEYKDCNYLSNNHDNFVVVAEEKMAVYNAYEILTDSYKPDIYNHAIVDKDNNIWIGHPVLGLSNPKVAIIYPQGPPYILSSEISIRNNIVFVAGGHFTPEWWKGRGCYYLEDEEWKTLKLGSAPRCINYVEADPADPTHVFLGSGGWGLHEYYKNENSGFFEEYKTYDETNSPLENIDEYGPSFTIPGGMDYDNNNNLWLALYGVPHPIYVFKRDKEIKKIENIEYDFTDQTIIELVVSENNIWLLMNKEKAGIYAFNHNGTIDNETDDRKKFFEVVNQNDKKFAQLKSMAVDKDGNIWVGTGEGPVVYYDPEEVFEVDKVEGHQITIPREDGTSLADYALGTEVIKAIAVDGANRKWFGTEKSGVYLFSEDVSEEISHFDEDNSPLLSNSIECISINHENGEVFLGTNKGIISYKSDATEPEDDFTDVYVYPNPIHHDYDGNITITGLAENSNIKITDISGNIVYEDSALGGQVIWDGLNFSGKRVSTGVYLVFCTTEDGAKTYVTKLLFFN